MERLEEAEQPQIAAFFQIPLPILVEKQTYWLPAMEHGVKFGLEFYPFVLSAAPDGSIILEENSRSDVTSNSSAATQLVAFVPLWGKESARV